MERALEGAVVALTDRVVFDLRDVTFLDVCALRTLLRADARARRESFAVEIIPPPVPLCRIFGLTHADRELTLLGG